MTMLKTTLACAALAAAVPTASHAAIIVVDVTGAQSFGARGAAGNVIRTVNIGAGSIVTGVGYDVTITASSPSYLSEAALAFTNSANTAGVLLTPGVGVNSPGSGTYVDAVDLTAEDLNFTVGSDGILRLEFFETFNDSSVSPDAIWTRGTITFRYDEAIAAVPEPATWAMMTLGFGAVGFAMRRRAKVATRVRFA
ncbi:PEPxxWA-CTERM sorting domain-containing protein [Sphingomonas sp. RS2018]